MQAKGKLKIEVDDSSLKASLVFVPHSKGQIWNKPKVKNLLEEKGIIEGVKEDAIDKALEEFGTACEEAGIDANAADAEARGDDASDVSGDPKGSEEEPGGEALRRVVAESTPPEPGNPGYWEWGEFSIPEELKEDAERVLKTAPPPEISRTRSKKEKVKKKVRKKSKLPFGKPREEVVEKTETKTWEEPVDVDPKVLQSGWVDEGQTLASWSKGEKGKDGTSIYGTPVSSDQNMEEELLAGRGAKVAKDGVVAATSGFFRRGSGWVEVIPFNRHTFEVSLSIAQATCFLDFTPGGESATLPKAEHIRAKAVELGFPEEDLLSEEEINTIVQSAVSLGQSLEKKPICKDVDGWFTVEASSDNLKGLLHIKKGSGNGKKIILKEIGAEIKKSGFKGMDFEKIKKDLLEFFKGGDRELKDYVLVEGKAPSRGEDRSLEFTCTFVGEEEQEKLQSVDAGGEGALEAYPSLGDYPVQSVTRMAYVKKDSVVAELTEGKKGEEGVDVYGSKLEGLPGNDPLIALKENVQLSNDKIYAGEEGVLDVIEGEEEEETTLRVREHVDSVVSVTLSEDNMSASLSLTPARGTGEPLSLEKVNKVLEENGVKKGINSHSISDSIEAVRSGETVENVVVAEGIPPIEPGQSRLKFHVRRASGKGLTVKEDGSADYKNQDRITEVKKDQLIGEIISSDTQSKDGWDVKGKTLKAKEPPPLAIEIGDNVVQKEEDNGDIKLYAENSGELYYDQKRLEVSTVHTVENVDMSTGNIEFPGEVQVKGNVHEGFYVMAGGDVKIAGTSETCLVSSGKTATIMQGIVGGNKGAVRAKTDIESTFAEQATLLAVGDIKLKNSCLRCNVKCNGTLKLAGDKGDLVGGAVYSRHGVEAHDIGNEKKARTTISFGQDYLVADQIEQQEKKIKKIKNYIAKLDSAMSRYEKAGNQKKLNGARREKLKYMKMMEKRSVKLFSLRERYEEHFESSVTVNGKIYPGVVLESHGRFYEVSAPKEKVVFTFNGETGKIEEQEISKE